MFAYMVVLLICCWDISGCAWGVSLKEGQRRWLEWCLAIPPHGKRGPANESEPWTERTVVTVKPHRVTLYFRNITDPWMSAQPEKIGEGQRKLSVTVYSAHIPLWGEWVISISESNNKATACAVGWASWKKDKHFVQRFFYVVRKKS